jgi:hypothetical protein
MIVEAIINMFFGLITRLMPSYDGSFGIPDGFIEMFQSIMESVAWFLPLNVLVPLFLVSIGIDIFHIGWKIFLRIKSFIPTMGS